MNVPGASNTLHQDTFIHAFPSIPLLAAYSVMVHQLMNDGPKLGESSLSG
uniref:Uncharacterized protein n=1 Tax=Rhizophora mucronata TaxID=61149 RepID=A0A2P2NWZ3_RHIMU